MGRERREFDSIRKLAPAVTRPSTRVRTSCDTGADPFLGEDRCRRLAPRGALANRGQRVAPPKARAEKARATAKTPDFETYAKKWIAKRLTDKGEPLRASTRAHYEATLEPHLVPTFGRMRLRDITKWCGAPLVRRHAGG